jgi:predicted nuclease of predicted toxin-antitoxin system
LKLLLDEMLAPAIAAELRRRGHDVVAINEQPDRRALSDPQVVALGRHEQRAVVTSNLRDFRPLHAELIAAGGEGHSGMVFIPTNYRLTKAATGQIVTALEAKLREYTGDDDLANAEAWI